jgi:Mn2+/Fe2+ NRAMP family transporter
VEHVLLVLCAVFVAYVGAGLLAGPDWGAVAHGLAVPAMPLDRDTIVVVAATVGTTLAPWGLAFIQSYAVDKGLTARDVALERVDVVTGAVMTGVIGLFIVVACAATLHAQSRHIHDAADAASALDPPAGGLAATLFAGGLPGAALLAASIVPLSTAYSVSEALGVEGRLDDPWREARVFHVTYALVVLVAVAVVLVPGAPLVITLVITQAFNAVLLLPLLGFICGLSSDRELMGSHALGRGGRIATAVAIAGLTACVAALAVLAVGA